MAEDRPEQPQDSANQGLPKDPTFAETLGILVPYTPINPEEIPYEDNRIKLLFPDRRAKHFEVFKKRITNAINEFKIEEIYPVLQGAGSNLSITWDYKDDKDKRELELNSLANNPSNVRDNAIQLRDILNNAYEKAFDKSKPDEEIVVPDEEIVVPDEKIAVPDEKIAATEKRFTEYDTAIKDYRDTFAKAIDAAKENNPALEDLLQATQVEEPEKTTQKVKARFKAQVELVEAENNERLNQFQNALRQELNNVDNNSLLDDPHMSKAAFIGKAVEKAKEQINEKMKQQEKTAEQLLRVVSQAYNDSILCQSLYDRLSKENKDALKAALGNVNARFDDNDDNDQEAKPDINPMVKVNPKDFSSERYTKDLFKDLQPDANGEYKLKRHANAKDLAAFAKNIVELARIQDKKKIVITANDPEARKNAYIAFKLAIGNDDRIKINFGKGQKLSATEQDAADQHVNSKIKEADNKFDFHCKGGSPTIREPITKFKFWRINKARANYKKYDEDIENSLNNLHPDPDGNAVANGDDAHDRDLVSSRLGIGGH